MTKRILGGFEQSRGEHQRPGDRNILGVPPQPGNIPIGPAPPAIRQVISQYDSRPIGGYDFVLSDSFDPIAGQRRADVQSPKGFITVVRRIEIDCSPSFLLATSPVWNFLTAGVSAIAWNWNTGRFLSSAGIATFFVVPPDTQYSLISPNLSVTSAEASAELVVRFIGNLILDTNEPPTEQVGSLPHAVYAMKKEF